jgi:hypothetical protein
MNTFLFRIIRGSEMEYPGIIPVCLRTAAGLQRHKSGTISPKFAAGETPWCQPSQASQQNVQK